MEGFVGSAPSASSSHQHSARPSGGCSDFLAASIRRHRSLLGYFSEGIERVLPSLPKDEPNSAAVKLKIWKLIVTIHRFDLLALAVSQTCTDVFGVPLLNEPVVEQRSSEGTDVNNVDRLRWLFLCKAEFRLLLALIDWCEWMARDRKLHDCSERPPVGNLKYRETCLSASTKLGGSGIPYHLDLPFALPTTTKNLPRVPLFQIKPNDSQKADRLFESVWACLLQGDLQELSARLVLSGEPWLDALVSGLRPVGNPESRISAVYDITLASLPTEVAELWDVEFSMEGQLVGLVEKPAPWSWMADVLFKVAGPVAVERDESGVGDHYVDGNPWRPLLIEAAKAAVFGPAGDSLSSHEKAFYGYLAGSAEMMAPACLHWHEYLWADCLEFRDKFLSRPVGREKLKRRLEAAFQTALMKYPIRCPDERLLHLAALKLVRASMDSAATLDFGDFLLDLHRANLASAVSTPAASLGSFGAVFAATFKESVLQALPAGAEGQWMALCDELLWQGITSDLTRSAVAATVYLLQRFSSATKRSAIVQWMLSWEQSLEGRLPEDFECLQEPTAAVVSALTDEVLPVLVEVIISHLSSLEGLPAEGRQRRVRFGLLLITSTLFCLEARLAEDANIESVLQQVAQKVFSPDELSSYSQHWLSGPAADLLGLIDLRTGWMGLAFPLLFSALSDALSSLSQPLQGLAGHGGLEHGRVGDGGNGLEHHQKERHDKERRSQCHEPDLLSRDVWDGQLAALVQLVSGVLLEPALDGLDELRDGEEGKVEEEGQPILRQRRFQLALSIFQNKGFSDGALRSFLVCRRLADVVNILQELYGLMMEAAEGYSDCLDDIVDLVSDLFISVEAFQAEFQLSSANEGHTASFGFRCWTATGFSNHAIRIDSARDAMFGCIRNLAEGFGGLAAVCGRQTDRASALRSIAADLLAGATRAEAAATN